MTGVHHPFYFSLLFAIPLPVYIDLSRPFFCWQTDVVYIDSSRPFFCWQKDVVYIDLSRPFFFCCQKDVFW
jgi:hypothetical protein